MPTCCRLSVPLSCPVALRLTEAIPAHSRGRGSRRQKRAAGRPEAQWCFVPPGAAAAPAACAAIDGVLLPPYGRMRPAAPAPAASLSPVRA